MSQLNALIKYKKLVLDIEQNQFDNYPLSDNMQLINVMLKDHGVDVDTSRLDQIMNHYNEFNQKHSTIKHSLEEFVKDIDQEIDKLVNQILNDRLFCEYQSAYTQAHEDLTDSDIEDEIFEILKKYISNWQYPGMVMYPRSLRFVAEFVTLDPLYVLFMNKAKEKHVLNEFSQQYQNRLRVYEIDHPNFSSLPREQMGIIYCHDLLKVINSGQIDNCISGLIDLLKPGGHLVFGYINSDSPDLVNLFEHHRFSYYNNRKLLSLVNDKGVELVLTRDWKDYGSLAIIKRPGELKTLKAHQALGLVKPI